MTSKLYSAALTVTMALALALPAAAQDARVNADGTDKWLTVTDSAAGTTPSAQDEAVRAALRKAVEQGCGVFLASRSKSQDFKLVYDKVFADAVGYVKEYKLGKVTVDGEKTTVTVTALVSTQKFEQSWATIAHTIAEEGNPRVIMIITEGILSNAATMPTGGSGIVQGKLEDFFISKGVKMMDRETAVRVSDRDKELAAIKDDAAELAALGARFKADVVVVGKAVAKWSRELTISGARMQSFTAQLTIRAIQTDSARLLMSKSFDITLNTMQLGGGGDKALTKLADDKGPEVLAAVVEAWRKRAQVSRTFELNVSGMDFAAYKTFEKEAKTLRGMRSIDLKEITEAVANIDVEYEFDHKILASALSELKDIKLEITEITPNRLKLKVVK